MVYIRVYAGSDSQIKDIVTEPYLGLPEETEDGLDLSGQFDPDRFFCLVGRIGKTIPSAAAAVGRATLQGRPEGQNSVSRTHT